MVYLNPGQNDVNIVERFDSGTLDAQVQKNDLPYSDLENAIILNDRGELEHPPGVSDGGQFGYNLAPGRYVTLAGTNDRLMWAWAGAQWRDPQFITAVKKLGTAFRIRSAKTTKLTVPDRTVELQNLTASLGLEMDRR
jgi:hypothetical protein